MTIRLAGRHSWVMCSVYVLFGAWFSPLHAQEAGKDAAMTWCEKARGFAKKSELRDADNAFREAVKLLDEQAQQRGNEASFWAGYYQCVNDQANHWGVMERFDDAEKQYRNTLFVLPTLQAKKFPGDPVIQLTWAKAHEGLGDLYRTMERSTLALKDYEEALKLLRNLVQQYPASREYRQELADVLNRCALEQMKQARFRDAEVIYREELQVWHKLVQENPNAPDCREGLANAYNAYGTLARESGRYILARDLIRGAIQVAQPLMDAFPAEPKYWRNLPAIYRNLGMTLETLRIHGEQAVAVREGARCQDRLDSLPTGTRPAYTEADVIATCLRRRGVSASTKPGEDMDTLLQKAETQAREHADVPAFRSQLVAARIVLATHMTTGHLYKEALGLFREALAGSEALVKDFPQLPRYRKLQASALARLGILYYVKDEPKEGDKHIQAAYAVYRKLADDYPDEPLFRRAEDEEMDPLMRFMLDRGNNDKVLEIMASALGQLKKLVEQHPACPQYRIYHATAQQSQGHMLGRMRNDKGAEEAFRASIDIWARAMADFPHIVELNACHAQAKSYLLQLYNRQKRWADAEAVARDMLPARQKLIDAAPTMARFHADLAVDLAWLATLAIEQRRPEQALDYFNQSIAMCEKAFALQPTEREYLLLLRESYRSRAEVHQQSANFAAYQKDEERGRDLAEWLDTSTVRLMRIRQRLEDGKLDLVRREAEDLFAGIELTGAEWYDLAGVYARLTKNNDPALRDQAAGRAVTCLGNALRNGYQPIVSFGDEEQFRPLFARADFRQLLPVRPAGK